MASKAIQVPQDRKVNQEALDKKESLERPVLVASTEILEQMATPASADPRE